MKDKNGIEICCKNCNDDVAINCLHYNPDNPDEDWGCVVSGRFTPSYDALFARIAELKELISTLKHKLTRKEQERRHESSIRDKLIAKLERELRFTDEEIDFIKKAISMAIIDCETNPPKPSDKNLKLMWSIKSKCDAILKGVEK